MRSVTVRLSGKINPMPMYLKGTLMRRRGLKQGERLPEMIAEFKGFRIDKRHFNRVSSLCDLGHNGAPAIIYPLTLIFPLHMSLITHQEFPLFFPRMLHVRDHIVQHQGLDRERETDISCRIIGQRILHKGLEFDIHSRLSQGGDPVWESISTNYFPGAFGTPTEASPLAVFSPMPDHAMKTDWKMPTEGRFTFGLLSGDYNGIHYSASYAKLMGFKRDFSHSRRSLAECLRHLPEVDAGRPLRLDAAIKGPVYYGSRVVMSHAADEKGIRFDLHATGDSRPCITAYLSHAGKGTVALDQQAS